MQSYSLPDREQEDVQLEPLLLVLSREAVARHRSSRPLAPGKTQEDSERDLLFFHALVNNYFILINDIIVQGGPT